MPLPIARYDALLAYGLLVTAVFLLRLETARLAAFLFMFVNGAIVFASGAGRLAGIASVTAVLLTLPARRRRATLS